MDPRHRQILKAFQALSADGKCQVAPIDVALQLGLRDARNLGVFFDEVRQLGWTRPVTKGFTGDVDFELTADGAQELAEAERRPPPPATIEDLDAQLRAFLEFWTYDQPFTAETLRSHLAVDGLRIDDVRRLLRQMEVRGMVRPHHSDGWYPS